MEDDSNHLGEEQGAARGFGGGGNGTRGRDFLERKPDTRKGSSFLIN